MTTQDTANALVALWKAGKFDESGENYWADEVLSVEAMGDNAEMRGKDAVRGKGEWWAKAHEVHGAEVEGPYVNGDQFVVRFKLDLTVRETGQRMTMDEMALYTIKADKIAEERFFYSQ
jgi:ketosteroid isomerase-like protein